ncbi:restriction endonuclease subunit S [Daejeonella rubra]|nr:restriction endonuclease subunit S [Daejeonella rubra]
MNISLPKYEQYKDSGVEWLGEIPEEWQTTKVKNVFTLIIDPAPKNNAFELLSVYTDIGVKPRRELEERGNKASTTDGYWFVKKGDIVVNKLLAWMGAIGVSNYDGVTSPAYDILRAKIKIESNFFHYLFRNDACISELKRHSRGIMDMRLRLYFDKFGDIIIPFPKYEEQLNIVSFLDRKTAIIDQAIGINEKQIELLKERRQILIHKAVTRGLNPDVKMKDSRVEWIGEIPEGWEVKKLRYLANCFPSNVDKHSKVNEKEVRLCNYTDVYKNDFITDDMDLMVATASDEQINKFTLKKGDIVITKDSETASDIAVPTYIKENLTNVICGYHLAIIKTYQINYSKYLFQALKTKLFNTQFEICSNGITRVGLGNSDLRNGYFLLPSPQEQIEIAEFIEKGTAKIATAISLKEQEIEKLKEYKATLINSAVTGKIKVCEPIN